MYILGLGGSDHDVSSCLLKDDQILIAIEEERVTRKKYGFYSNLLFGHSRNYCLQNAGIQLDDVELVVADAILAPTASHAVRHRMHVLNHHLAHAASAFYPSPFEEAAILVVDNAGGLVSFNGKTGIETVTYAVGKGNEITVLDKVIGDQYGEAEVSTSGKAYQLGDPNNSLGHFYKIISHYCGFDFLNNENFYFTEDGKTMGLAPYGTDRYYEQIRPFIHLLPDGGLRIDLHTGELQSLLEELTREELTGEDEYRRKADIAWAGQKCQEDVMIHFANSLYEKTGLKNLCIAGGSGLNSVANGKILKQTPFENIFVQPAAGDNGTSIGCAMWGYYMLKGMPRTPNDRLRMDHAYLGRSYSDAEIEEALTQFPDLEFEVVESPAQAAAERIAAGQIIGWFQGGSEFGPRALGHRSILANPTLPHMKDEINHRVKFREGFRPFAPAVLEEAQTTYFDLDQVSPFMLIVCDVVPEHRATLPAITHVDGTARVQTVTKHGAPEFYELIDKLGAITGVPVVLNTSFNVKGEPIVETPHDAMRCFSGTNMDTLILSRYVVTKKGAAPKGGE